MTTSYQDQQRTHRKDMHRVLCLAVQYVMTAETALEPRMGVDTNSRYICNAIDRVTSRSNTTSLSAGQKLKQLISKRMNYWPSLEVWLDHEANIPFKDQTLELMQVYRHAWLQELIKEFTV